MNTNHYIVAPQGKIPRGRYYMVVGDAGPWLIPFDASGKYEPSRRALASYPGKVARWSVHDVLDGTIPED